MLIALFFGTALAVNVLMTIIFYLDLSGALLRKGREIGKFVQVIVSLLMILIGIYDSFLYWM